MVKDKRWEVFLLDASKKKCKHHMKLQELVLNLIKESIQETPGHTAAETMGTSLLDDEVEQICSRTERFAQNPPESPRIHQNPPESPRNAQVHFGAGGSQTAMRMTGEVPKDALRQHQASMLDAISLRDLPRNEIYEMQDGTSVVRHDLRYANFFREVCLEQQDLLEELASSEENYFIVRREAKRTKKKYLAKVDQLCSLLKKRLDRPDSDTESDIYPSEGSFQIRRT